jgi:hypothetical protein
MRSRSSHSVWQSSVGTSAWSSKRTFRKDVSSRLLLALLIALLLCAGLLERLWQPEEPELTPTLLRYSSFLSDRDGLPPQLTSAWAISGPRSMIHTAESRAVRLGAITADLEVVSDARNAAAGPAYWKHDSAAIITGAANAALVAAFAGELAVSFEDVPNSGTAVDLVRRIEREGLDVATISSTELEMAVGASLVSRPHLMGVGSWLEVARIAARRHDDAFFLRPETLAAVNALMSVPHLPEGAIPAIQAVRSAYLKRDASGLGALEGALTEALRVLTAGPRPSQ